MIKKNRGQSLIEVVFVTMVIFLILTGLVGGTLFTLKAVRYAKNKSKATQIAKELLEEIKGKKQLSSFWGNISGECNTSGNTGEFLYKVTCSNLAAVGEKYSADVEVIVWWDSPTPPSGGKNKVVVKTNISNWER